MKDNNKSTCWPFKLDEVSFYAWAENVFTKQECDLIIETCLKKGISKAGVSKESLINEKIRDSDVVFMFPEELNWVFPRLTDIITALNEKFFKFNLFGFQEGIQFTVYKKNQKYKRHVDRVYQGKIRKLSLSVQLSEPKTYKGGDLVLYEGEGELLAKKEVGSITLFPSFVEHEVRPVIKGTRYSLVAWITGDSFK